jgi:hypothetical protein
MNKIVNNLAQIADAAEYFDKKTGAAWKIRSALTNMVVWSCNSYLYAVKSDSVERVCKSMVEVATLRSWVRDSDNNAFSLDLTESAVAKTLGLERVVDTHIEAVRSARQKCIQTRSALHFKKYYDEAIAAFDEQRRVRQDSVTQIAELLAYANAPFTPTFDEASYLSAQLNIDAKESEELDDSALYDDAAVERQADQLAETVGNALEAMYDVCDAELAAAITQDKVNRLTGYHRAITNMMKITGVDMTKLAQRRVKLEALIEAQIDLVSASVADIDASIADQLAEPAPVVEAPKSKARRIKKEDLAKELRM